MLGIGRGRSRNGSPDRVLIHIGKCGGASLKAALRKTGLADGLRIVHVRQPVYRKHLRYIVVARNPFDRTISAFNWRYRLVVAEEVQRNRFPGEHEVLTRYGSLETLGEALYGEDGTPNFGAFGDMRRIHHIREDIGHYLTKLLDRCRPDQIEAVLMQETLNADIERMFGIGDVERLHDNRGMRGGPMSAAARANLMRYLHRDYEALARLYAWGKIDAGAYARAIA